MIYPTLISDEPISGCLICLKTISATVLTIPGCTVEFAEILLDVFNFLCKHMNWTPSAEYVFNFNKDPFPFCTECKLSIVSLYKLHEQLDEIQQKINQVTSAVRGKILQSQHERKHFSISNQHDLGQKSSTEPEADKKCNHYRNTTWNRFTPYVQLTSAHRSADLPIRNINLVDDTNYYIPGEQCHSDSTNAAATATYFSEQPPEIDLMVEGHVMTAFTNAPQELVILVGTSEDEEHTGQNFINNVLGVKELPLVEQLQKPDSETEVANDFTERPPLIDLSLENHTLTSLTSDNQETLMQYLYQYEKEIIANSKIQTVGNFTFIYHNKYHFGRMNKYNQWCCIFCRGKFSNKASLVRHLKICPGSAPPDNMVTLTYKQFTYDKLTNDEFQCRHCKQTSSSEEDIIKHLKKLHRGRFSEHISDAKIVCETCGKYFTTTSILRRHYQLKHKDERPCPCEICGRKFTTNSYLTQHQNRVHSSSKKGVGSVLNLSKREDSSLVKRKEDSSQIHCKTCGKRFSRKFYLWRHQFSHSKDERPIYCKLCGKIFKTGLDLIRHRSHVHLRKETKFPCELCGRKFENVTSLKFHRRKHGNFSCSICGSVVPITKFKSHMLIHSKKGFYSCSN